jgi:hypothetical protein
MFCKVYFDGAGKKGIEIAWLRAVASGWWVSEEPGSELQATWPGHTCSNAK